MAQALQHVASELRQLIEKQHPMVGQRHLARFWVGAAADQGDRGASSRVGEDEQASAAPGEAESAVRGGRQRPTRPVKAISRNCLEVVNRASATSA